MVARTRLLSALAPIALLVACGQSVEEHYAAARTAYFASDFHGARKELVLALRQEPRHQTVLGLLVQTNLRLGDAEGAKAALSRYKAAKAKGPAVIRLEAETLLVAGSPGDALKKLGSDNHPEAWRVRAQAYLKMGDFAAAEGAFRSGLAAGENARLAADYADYAFANEDYGTAREMHALVRRLAPNSLETLLLGGRLAMKDGKFALASTTFDKARKDYPVRFEPLLAQAELLELSGKVKQAEKLVNKAAEIAPDSWLVGEMRLRLMAEQGQWKKIRDSLQPFAHQLDPTSARGMTYAEALLRMGRAEQARIIFRRTVLLMPENRYAIMMLGEAQLATEDPDAAYATLEPLVTSVLATKRELELAERAAREGEYPKAAELRARLQSPDFGKQQALINAGQAAMGRQDWQAALDAYRRLVAFGSDASLQAKIDWLVQKSAPGAAMPNAAGGA